MGAVSRAALLSGPSRFAAAALFGAWVLALSCAPAAAQSSACALGITGARAEPGSTVCLDLVGGWDLPLKGLQASIFLDEKLSIDMDPGDPGAVPLYGAPTCIGEPDFFDVSQGEGCVSLGIILDLSTDRTCPPARDQRTLRLPVAISSEALPGERLCLRLEDGCGIRMIPNLLGLQGATQAVACRPAPEDRTLGCSEVVADQTPPDTLACRVEGGTVQISWRNLGQYEEIEVYRARIEDGEDGEEGKAGPADLLATLNGAERAAPLGRRTDRRFSVPAETEEVFGVSGRAGPRRGGECGVRKPLSMPAST